MRKVLIVLVVFVLAACATLGGDRTVNVTGDQIAQKLNEKLALPISLLKVFDVSFCAIWSPVTLTVRSPPNVAQAAKIKTARTIKTFLMPRSCFR